MQSEIAAAMSDTDAAEIRAAFEQRERALEHEIGKSSARPMAEPNPAEPYICAFIVVQTTARWTCT
jgi:hypothetical protein